MRKISSAFVVVLATNLFAYTPPADFIVGEMAKMCLGMPVQFNGMVQDGTYQAFVDFSLRQDGVSIVKRTPVLATSDQKSLSGEEKIDLGVLDLLVNCDRAKKIKDYLKTHGVDSSIVSHGFYNYDPVYIIGAQPKDDKAPQLWIDRKFLPVKEVQSGGREARFEQWIALDAIADKHWPRTVTTAFSSKTTIYNFSEGPKSGTTMRK